MNAAINDPYCKNCFKSVAHDLLNSSKLIFLHFHPPSLLLPSFWATEERIKDECKFPFSNTFLAPCSIFVMSVSSSLSICRTAIHNQDVQESLRRKRKEPLSSRSLMYVCVCRRWGPFVNCAETCHRPRTRLNFG